MAKILDKQFLGRQLFTLRRGAGMNQTDLGSKLGVRTSTVSRWEDGLNLPSAEHIQAIAKIFEKDPDFFYVEEAQPGRIVPGSVRFFDTRYMSDLRSLLERVDSDETARIAYDALSAVLAGSPEENSTAQAVLQPGILSGVRGRLARIIPHLDDSDADFLRWIAELPRVRREAAKSILRTLSKARDIARIPPEVFEMIADARDYDAVRNALEMARSPLRLEHIQKAMEFIDAGNRTEATKMLEYAKKRKFPHVESDSKPMSQLRKELLRLIAATDNPDPKAILALFKRFGVDTTLDRDLAAAGLKARKLLPDAKGKSNKK